MKKTVRKGFFIVWFISVIYGVIAIPIDILILHKSTSFGLLPTILSSFRSCGLITLIVAVFSTFVLIVLRLFARTSSRSLRSPLQHATLIASGIFIILFFLIFDNFYNKFEALIVAEFVGGTVSLLVIWIFYILLRSDERSKFLDSISPKVTLIGMLIIVILYGISFLSPREGMLVKIRSSNSSKSERPNILLIVLDTVRADHTSLYGYHVKTTPFLEKMAMESVVFKNAFAASPWTLPSHASLFTGLYPSQHRTHAEHMWLDDSFRTLAEILHDNGYQTICFSNNDYVSSYHNLLQGFERTWYKGCWTDDNKLQAHTLGRSIVSFFYWLWDKIKKNVLANLIENPASIWAYPNATITNKAVTEWLEDGRDESRPFFIFINYMDAHLPYNPNDETARLFFNEEELKISYRKRLRFPPIEYCLDVSKGRYTKSEIQIIKTLYDACIRGLDGELEKLIEKLRGFGIYDNTLVIITSDHGEYLGERNRFAHGLGLHDELLHIPLMVRYPPLFEPNIQKNAIVILVDVLQTILSFAKIDEHPKGMPEIQLLFDVKEDSRPFVFGEFFFPVHLLIDVSLREDNSNLCVEQKTIHSQTQQLIWKSRGEFEFYNVIDDPLEINNLYSRDNKRAEEMNQHLINWFNSLYIPPVKHELIDRSESETLKLIERLRALGYIK